MSTEKVITTNAVHVLEADANLAVSHARKTTIVIIENSASATVTIGIVSEDGDFVAFANGLITDDGTFNHGRGAKLAALVADIADDSVTIGFYQA